MISTAATATEITNWIESVEGDDAALERIAAAVADLRAMIEREAREAYTQEAGQSFQQIADGIGRSFRRSGDDLRGALNRQWDELRAARTAIEAG